MKELAACPRPGLQSSRALEVAHKTSQIARAPRDRANRLEIKPFELTRASPEPISSCGACQRPPKHVEEQPKSGRRAWRGAPRGFSSSAALASQFSAGICRCCPGPLRPRPSRTVWTWSRGLKALGPSPKALGVVRCKACELDDKLFSHVLFIFSSPVFTCFHLFSMGFWMNVGDVFDDSGPKSLLDKRLWCGAELLLFYGQ